MRRPNWAWVFPLTCGLYSYGVLMIEPWDWSKGLALAFSSLVLAWASIIFLRSMIGPPPVTHKMLVTAAGVIVTTAAAAAAVGPVNMRAHVGNPDAEIEIVDADELERRLAND